MAKSRGTGREAAADGPAGQRPDAEGGGLPEATGGSKAASADPEVEAGKVTGDGEKRPNSAGFASESEDSEGEAFRRLSDAREEAAVSAGIRTRKNRLWRLLGRLRGSIFWERPKSRSESGVPSNLRPWTGEILPHVRETREDGTLVHLMDWIAWYTTRPPDRYILHAERRRSRRESLGRWALRRFSAAVVGRPPGAPPWLVEDQRDDET